LTGGVAPPPPNGAPYAAAGLTAPTAGNGQISLSWTDGSGATSYNLYRAAESGYGSAIAPLVTGIIGTSYVDTGLNDGTTYYYQVVAVNSSGPSGFSPRPTRRRPASARTRRGSAETDTALVGERRSVSGIETSSYGHSPAAGRWP
jgi:cellulose 1,4-beta-cellobiosidase